MSITREIQERDQAGNILATYVSSSTSSSAVAKNAFSRKERKIFDPGLSNEVVGRGLEGRIDVIVPERTNSYAKSVSDAFLPAGYPQSVTADYLEYQIYDSLQAFSSSIAGMLSSRAVLEGIGVGDQYATPTTALLLSVLQESMGRIATILFAHKLGTALEPECKMYRLTADIFNDSAMILDCLSPALPKPLRVGLLSLSSVLRALCGVAAGSSKASLSAHFATKGNLGELNAKDSSQETIISLLGMLVGTLVVSNITSQWATWLAMILLLAIHLFTNYMAVRAVCMRTLNRQRANILFSDYLSQVLPRPDVDRETTLLQVPQLSNAAKLLTPQTLSNHERIFEKDGILRWTTVNINTHSSTLRSLILGTCHIGVPFSRLLALLSPPSSGKRSYNPSTILPSILNLYTSQGYILWYDRKRTTFLIILKEGSDVRDQIRGWVHALYAAWVLYHLKKPLSPRDKDISRSGSSEEDDQALLHVFTQTMHVLTQVFSPDETGEKDLFTRLEESGWDITIGAMETMPGRRIALPRL
ncbi:vitamin B6 photo-protection and homoeostasis-domain-containing protein [Xylogone sp. PMI_703]|nr:vitamin B6 photo-protection and homoeostasis-domain-containing protein [Xylogone sp. PMI_703]